MKIHLIKKQSVLLFVSKHTGSKVSFEQWLEKIKYADWEAPGDILRTFGHADLLGRNSDRVIFNVGGNDYRLICRYFFGDRYIHLFVCWIGTHAQYSRLCRRGLQFTVNEF